MYNIFFCKRRERKKAHIILLAYHYVKFYSYMHKNETFAS